MSIIKSFSVGSGDIKGDMFYIDHGSDNFTVIDCCLEEHDREDIVGEIKTKSSFKGITRFISTHPDADHIQDLVYLDDNWNILNFYCVKNEATKADESDDFDRYCELRDSSKAFYLYKGCSRKWMNQSDEQRGSAGINVRWPETSNEHFKTALKTANDGGSPNNISPIISYSVNDGVRAMWMGDLETAFMEKIEDAVELYPVDILFAPHHGRESGKIPSSWLKQLDPKVIVIGEAPSKHLNYYAGYNTITQNSAKDITFECVGDVVNVFVSNDSYSVDFLDDNGLGDTYGTYIGSFDVHACAKV